MFLPRIRIATATACVVVAALAALDARTSNADPPTGAPYATYQPSIARLASGRFVMAFDDESGAWDVDAAGHRTPKAHPSYAGVAYSDDGGDTWTREPTLPTNESCAEPPCVRALVGDTHVVAPPYPEQRAFYV